MLPPFAAKILKIPSRRDFKPLAGGKRSATTGPDHHPVASRRDASTRMGNSRRWSCC